MMKAPLIASVLKLNINKHCFSAMTFDTQHKIKNYGCHLRTVQINFEHLTLPWHYSNQSKLVNVNSEYMIGLLPAKMGFRNINIVSSSPKREGEETNKRYETVLL